MDENSREDIMRFIQQNIVPISYIVATTCIGYLVGYTSVGLVVGILTVCMANLFSYTGWMK
jgi:hypothetical protein